MATLTGGVTAPISIAYTVPSGIVAGQSLAIPLSLSALIQPGTGAGQCDTIYARTLSLAVSTPQVINLQSFTDILGNTGVSLARVRFLAWRNQATTDGWVVKLGTGTTPWDGLAVAGAAVNAYPSFNPGTGTNFDGFCIWTAPNTTGAVVGGSTNNLKVDPGAHAILLDLIIAGASI